MCYSEKSKLDLATVWISVSSCIFCCMRSCHGNAFCHGDVDAMSLIFWNSKLNQFFSLYSCSVSDICYSNGKQVNVILKALLFKWCTISSVIKTFQLFFPRISEQNAWTYFYFYYQYCRFSQHLDDCLFAIIGSPVPFLYNILSLNIRFILWTL